MTRSPSYPIPSYTIRESIGSCYLILVVEMNGEWDRSGLLILLSFVFLSIFKHSYESCSIISTNKSHALYFISRSRLFINENLL